MKLLVALLFLVVSAYSYQIRDLKEEEDVMQGIPPRKIACLKGHTGIQSQPVQESLFGRLGHAIRDYHKTTNKSIHGHNIKSIVTGKNLDWNEYKGKVLLLVNVASFSKYNHQYTTLGSLMSTRRQDFRILGVPCHQFGLKEPGETGEEIMNTLKYVRPGRGFVPNFELTEKVNVNGPKEHALFTTLKGSCPSPITKFAPKYLLGYDVMDSTDIRWNFEKFLIDKDGHPLVRYSSEVLPEDIMTDINSLITNPEEFKRDLQKWNPWGVTIGEEKGGMNTGRVNTGEENEGVEKPEKFGNRGPLDEMNIGN